MTTRAQVRQLLEDGHTYQTAARVLGIAPGEAFMIATGLPADGSDAYTAQELEGRGEMPASPQQLVNPRAFNPMRRAHVLDWVRERAARELSPGA